MFDCRAQELLTGSSSPFNHRPHCWEGADLDLGTIDGQREAIALMFEAKRNETAVVTNPRLLPTRYLPPGRIADTYFLYIASSRDQNFKAASFETFRRVYRSEWDTVLKYRKKRTHAMCSTCYALKTAIRRASGAHPRVELHTSELLPVLPWARECRTDPT